MKGPFILLVWGKRLGMRVGGYLFANIIVVFLALKANIAVSIA